MHIDQSILDSNTVYSPADVNMILDTIWDKCSFVGNGKIKYLNIPISVDLETSSFYDVNGDKTAIMYVWMIGIMGYVILGRTWDEYLQVCKTITEGFRTCGNKRHVLFYVHNLSFDFQNFLLNHHYS